MGQVRGTVLLIVVTFVATGCGVAHPFDASPAAPGTGIVQTESPSPFTQVTAGPVHALVPDGWRARPAASALGSRNGFFASPEPEAWRRMDGSISGMTVTWVDATRVGVPSDFYYLAASGPLMSQLTHSADCRAERQRVFLDHRPSFAAGPPNSSGDYMAQGEGTCDVRGHPTRWEYWVAAPGFGPVRELGIPSSGLYVVVAVMPDRADAAATLSRLIRNTSFAGATVPEFVAAASGRPTT